VGGGGTKKGIVFFFLNGGRKSKRKAALGRLRHGGMLGIERNNSALDAGRFEIPLGSRKCGVFLDKFRE